MKTTLKNIMLIDDDEDDNFFHQLMIQEAQIPTKVQVAQNAQEALQMIGVLDEKPDLIFLDLNMPKMNGWEFLKEYRLLKEKQQLNSVVILLTTSISPGDKEEAKKHPEIAAYKTKPMDVQMLNDIIVEYFT